MAKSEGKKIREMIDAELGARVREMIEKYPKQFDSQTMCAFSCGQILVSIASEMNAGELKFTIQDATYKGKGIGSWRVLIEKR